MIRKIASSVLLIMGVIIALGAYGHGFMGRLAIDAELNKFPIGTNVYTMLYVVWYFVSGCMLLFGAAIIWTWFRMRSGDTSTLFVCYLIGVLYLLSGVGGMIYRNGDPFMGMFVLDGALILLSGWAAKPPVPVGRPTRASLASG